MADAAVETRLTVDEYFALERESEERHEFLDGEVFAMGGASLAHNLLSTQLVQGLGPKVRQRGCTVIGSDLRVQIIETGLYTYPDLVIFCGRPELSREGGLDTLLNPRVIIEILSPSTEAYDRTTKFDHYRTIPSLREYLLVAQDERRVYRFLRQGETSRWEFVELGEDEVLEIVSVGVEIPLSELYDGVVAKGAGRNRLVASSDEPPV